MKYLVGIIGILAASIAIPASAQSIQNQSVTPLSSPSLAGSWIVSTKPINAYRMALTAGATAGYLMAFDSATVPADGAVVPKFCRAVAANASVGIVSLEAPARFNTGLVLVFSTTGCYAKAISNTAFFEASVK